MAVYFIQAGENGPIKIGYAADVEKRLAALQTGSHLELRLAGLMDGDGATEEDLHRRFVAFRIRGEWFRPNVGLTELIDQNPVPPAQVAKLDFIDALGGTLCVARRLNLAMTVISNWRDRGIAWRWRPAMATLAAEMQVPLPEGFLDPLFKAQGALPPRPASAGTEGAAA